MLKRIKQGISDLRALSSAMTSADVSESEQPGMGTVRPHPGTTLAVNPRWLHERGLWRGRATCEHTYTNSVGKITRPY